MKMMKKATALLLALMMVLSLAACGNSNDNGNKDSGNTTVDKTAQEVLDALKEKLGDSYGCDLAEDEDRMTNYYGLVLSQLSLLTRLGLLTQVGVKGRAISLNQLLYRCNMK